MLTGQYRFGVIMLPAEQSQQVQEIVGASGEAMRGTPVKKDGDYSYIAVSMEYTSLLWRPLRRSARRRCGRN